MSIQFGILLLQHETGASVLSIQNTEYGGDIENMNFEILRGMYVVC